MKRIFRSSFFFIVASTLISCDNTEILSDAGSVGVEEVYPDWDEQTHGSSADPDFATVFNEQKVQRIDIQVSEDNWATMQNDLESLFGGTGGPPPVGGTTSSENPVWVDCSIIFDSLEWYHVGLRYKGNSSLMSAYRSGIKKLSLKLDFDEFEDEYPNLKNQRFYGFKQLNLNNNFEDQSMVREKVGADLFREFGLASSHAAFYEVYVDNGSGPQYFGLYTLIEEVDDTVIEEQFINNTGNLYKPDGDAATFAPGSFDITEMNLKTNETEADYTDVEALYSIINSDLRNTDSALWKNQLEEVFDVDTYLHWLAANTVMQNWDTYGKMSHNFYLYADPATGLLTWIPWDNNEALQAGKMGDALSLNLAEVGNDWPLIRNIIDQQGYKMAYDQYVDEFTATVFTPERMEPIYTTYYNMLKDYAYAEEAGYTFLRSEGDFDIAIDALKSHVWSRQQAVGNYLQ